LAGIAFAAQYAAKGEARYKELLNKLDSYIITIIGPSIGFFYRNEPVFGAPVQLFDLISGLSGTVIYLLSRYGTSHEIDHAVETILRCLIQLACERDGVPVWHTPKTFSNSNDTMTAIFPNGHLNCGLAHGIPGPLGAMAIAKISGVEIDGLDHAIEHLATWILKNRHDDSWGMNWPTGIPLLMEGDYIRVGTALDSLPAHAGWCYGSPGLTRSIFLSGLALNREDLCAAGIRSIEAILRRPEPVRALNSPTFCHGLAGLLQIVLRFLNDAPSPDLEYGVQHLLSTLLRQYDSHTLLGIQGRTPDGTGIDSPALLDGAAGTALTLLSVRGDVEPAWDRAFLLS
jgi:hypothetical protein